MAPPLASGLAFIPGAISGAAGNLLSDRLAGAKGPCFTLRTGTAALIAGYGLTLVAAALGRLSAPLASCAVCLAGLGGAINTPCLANHVLKSVQPERGGIASAVFNTMRQVGGAVGIAIFGALTSLMPNLLAGMAASLSIAVALMLALLATTSSLNAR